MAEILLPRGKFVLVRRVTDVQTRKVHLPQGSAEATRYYVVATGEDVQKLNPGDEVMFLAMKGENFWPIPRHNDYLLVRDDAIALLIQQVDEEKDSNLLEASDVVSKAA